MLLYNYLLSIIKAIIAYYNFFKGSINKAKYFSIKTLLFII